MALGTERIASAMQARIQNEDCITWDLLYTTATIRLGPHRESRDDYREASVETIKRNLFVSSAARFFANVKKVSDEGLAQENRGQRTATAKFSII